MEAEFNRKPYNFADSPGRGEKDCSAYVRLEALTMVCFLMGPVDR